MKFKYLLIALPLVGAFSTSVLAIQKDITVTADIDPTLDLVQRDGTPLPASLTLGYDPSAGIQSRTINVAVLTNDVTKDINIRLANVLTLNNTTGAGNIAMKVALGGTDLTTTDSAISAASLGFDSHNKSLGKPLVISQATKAVVAAAGTYEGNLQLILAQKP